MLCLTFVTDDFFEHSILSQVSRQFRDIYSNSVFCSGLHLRLLVPSVDDCRAVSRMGRGAWTRLSIKGHIATAGMHALASLPSLHTLELCGLKDVLGTFRGSIGVEGLAVLPSFLSLHSLSIRACEQILDVGVVGWLALPSLRCLRFIDCGITGAGVAALARLTLQSLSFDRCNQLSRQLSNEPIAVGFAEYAANPRSSSLTSLHLRECSFVMDNVLEGLASFTSLTELSLVGSPFISAKGLTSLSSLTSLQILDLRRVGFCSLTDASVSALITAFESLHTLDVRQNQNITIASYGSILALPPSP